MLFPDLVPGSGGAIVLTMRPRFRVFASLAALFAFSASFAEGIWASTCGGVDSGDPAQMGAMASMAGIDAEADHMMMVMPMPESGSEDAGRTGASENAPDSSRCPLTAAMGSCAVVSLPTHEPGMVFAPPVQSTERGISAMTPDLLLATALLRPPRA